MNASRTSDSGMSLKTDQEDTAGLKLNIIIGSNQVSKNQSTNTNACLGLKSPTKFTDSHWVPLSDQFPEDFAYSAYLDGRNGERIVRVVAFLPSTNLMYCHIWLRDSSTTMGKNVETVRAGKAYIFRACAHNMIPPALLNCRVNSNSTPYAVSIVKDPCHSPSSAINVQDARVLRNSPPPGDDSFGVCVKPLHGAKQSTSRLVEFIEVNRMFGAQHITLYDFNANKTAIGPILDAYQKDGTLSLVPWNFPATAQRILTKRNTAFIYWVIECGQLAATTDCLYRNMNRFQYLAVVDMDEFLTPRANSSWRDLIKILPQNAGAYLFQNKFFRMDWMGRQEIAKNHAALNDSRAAKFNPKSLSVTKSEYVGEVYRPKYILRTEAAYATRVHRPRLFPSWVEYVVPKHLGLSHHYRNAGRSNRHLKGHPVEKDTYMWKYKDELLTRMERVFNRTGALVTD
ncbi:beta-1,4-galactosyltransferase galt-1 [Lingula anatina]|uniref:Glycosyltransferase family 92 protein n=1 Tax=Lingula anatina TaxID=7574 RepID=A0A1S3K758_LINAN|nr:beta-1,4-galactosyltransferase galt-1 [Lingula anatina]|eukprot:XP_013418463.1 beta-1,4-galactosyltransferase galt-1 [Lingula anatina]